MKTGLTHREPGRWVPKDTCTCSSHILLGFHRNISQCYISFSSCRRTSGFPRLRYLNFHQCCDHTPWQMFIYTSIAAANVPPSAVGVAPSLDATKVMFLFHLPLRIFWYFHGQTSSCQPSPIPRCLRLKDELLTASGHNSCYYHGMATSLATAVAPSWLGHHHAQLG